MSRIVYHWRAWSRLGTERPLFDSSPDGLRRAREQGLVLWRGVVCRDCHDTILAQDPADADAWGAAHRCLPPAARPGQDWTAEEDDLIRSGAATRDIAARTGRTIQAIQTRRLRLRSPITRPGKRASWTRRELQLVTDNLHKTAAELAQQLPRHSHSAVAKKLTSARRAQRQDAS